jgi:hypothetical protein
VSLPDRGGYRAPLLNASDAPTFRAPDFLAESEAQWEGGWRRALLSAVRERAVPIAITATVWCVGVGLEVVNRVRIARLGLDITALGIVPLFALCGLGCVTYEVVRTRVVERNGWRAAIRRTAQPERVAGLSATLLIFFFMLHAFAWLKSGVPRLVGFHADVRLARLDRALHGRDVWTYFTWLSPDWVRRVDAIYACWLGAVVLLVCWQAWQRDSLARRRFLLAFTFVWCALGLGGYYLVPAAGPCYYGFVTGDAARFAGLLPSLGAAPFALHEQAFLWASYSGAGMTGYSGIAAMPSLHVAVPVLGVLAAWRRYRPLALALVAYTVVIAIGSLRLGWHYAIDGEVGALGAAAIWWVVVRFFEPPPRHASG